ncbi:MAG: GNAT family N-acetyltransferase, partial [Nitrospiraceae bacterium]|nr:GNAT family N-acetyltransferase [Nitrospiraceae bacterium]
RKMSREEWMWKYTGEGERSVYSSVAKNASGEIVGHYGCMVQRAVHRGREISGISIGDVMTHPRFRGIRLFRDLATIGPTEAVRHGIVLGYGFPNERAFRLPEKLGLYEKVEDVFEAGKDVQFHNNLNRYAYRFFPLRYDDRRIDALWEQLKGGFHLTLIRDSRYLRWRYQKHPFFSYELWGLKKRWEMALTGLAVVRRDKDRMLLIDFVCPLDLLAALFQKVDNYAYTAGVKRLVFWLPDYLRDRIIRAGFSVNPAGTSIPRSTIEGYMKKEEMKGKFFYTMGDTDFL